MLAVGNTIHEYFTWRLRSFLYSSAFALLLSAGSVFAQQKVSVRVTDQTGASIRNAQVTLCRDVLLPVSFPVCAATIQRGNV
jgi:hypothetical protein